MISVGGFAVLKVVWPLPLLYGMSQMLLLLSEVPRGRDSNCQEWLWLPLSNTFSANSTPPLKGKMAVS